jgi:hypothetical protein
MNSSPPPSGRDTVDVDHYPTELDPGIIEPFVQNE